MGKERRLAGRYPTLADIEFDLCSRASGTLSYTYVLKEEYVFGTGVVLNLGTMGVCFTTDMAIELNSILRCFIYMEKRKKLIKLRCIGSVVRVDKSESGWQIALSLTTLEW